MPANIVAGPPRRQICSDWLLLVEGKDEVNLVNALMEHRFDPEPQIQVIDAGGVNKFSGNLSAIRTAARTRPNLRAIGVVRDAENDAANAFASVCGQLRDAGYEPPAGPASFRMPYRRLAYSSCRTATNLEPLKLFVDVPRKARE